jgi:hypothetical protein
VQLHHKKENKMITIKQIHSMRWGDAEHTCVGLTADTETGDGETLGTPYNDTSIIWADVQAFPIANISEYVIPIEESGV